MGPALIGRAQLAAIANAIGGLVCLAVAALLAWRPTRVATPTLARAELWVGVALTLPNPAAVTAWIMVAAAIGPLSPMTAVATALGVGVGSAGYFAGLATLASRAQPAPSRYRLDRVAALVMAALGMIAIGRAIAT